MPASSTGADVIVQSLQAKITAAYAQRMGGTPTLMSYANGVHSTFQGGPNGYWNAAALDDIDKTVSATNTAGLKTLGTQSFSQLYKSVLQAISYVVSAADLQVIQQEQQAAQATVLATIAAYEASFGPITPAQMNTAVPPSKIGYVQAQVQALWKGDITQAPSSLNTLKGAYQAYQVAAARSFQILNRSALAQAQLQLALANTTTPTSANGGLQTGAAAYQVAYGVPAQGVIDAGLQDPGNQLQMSVSVSSFSQTTAQGQVDGQAGFSLPLLDLLSIDLSGSAHYDWQSSLQSGASLRMDMTWPGVTVIGIVPAMVNHGTGWFDLQILNEALANAGQGNRVTGFQVQGSEFDHFFGPAGPFGTMTSALLSAPPTLSLTFSQVDAQALASRFQEQTSVSVNLFGFIPLGSASQSYQVTKVEQDSQAGSITITFGPPPQTAVIDSFEQTAYLLAGVVSYPPGKGPVAEAAGGAAARGRVLQPA